MKKMIFCFDGTCNEPEDSGGFMEDSSISNILKLHALFGGKLNPLNGKNKNTKNHTKIVGAKGFIIRAPFVGKADELFYNSD